MRIAEAFKKLIEKIKAALLSNDQRRRVLFYALNITLSLTSLIMTVVNLATGEYILMTATLIFAVESLINVLLLYFSRLREKIVYYVFAIESAALLIFFVISGIPNGFSALWFCLIPNFALLIFGVGSGSVLSLVSLGIMVFLFWVPAGRSLLMYSYTEEFMLRFPLLYSSIYLISLLIELVRRETQKQFESVKREYRYLYRHDALTGLYNRYGIEEYLESAFEKKTGGRAAIIIVDIDDFKSINDMYGHEFGDEVLKTVAAIPLRVMCRHCHCCRWGGEEFLMIMRCDHDAAAVAEEIRREVEQTPVSYNGEEVRITVSVGVCNMHDLSRVKIHDAIDHADRAMYRSKLNGKNMVTVFGQPLPESAE